MKASFQFISCRKSKWNVIFGPYSIDSHRRPIFELSYENIVKKLETRFDLFKRTIKVVKFYIYEKTHFKHFYRGNTRRASSADIKVHDRGGSEVSTDNGSRCLIPMSILADLSFILQ